MTSHKYLVPLETQLTDGKIDEKRLETVVNGLVDDSEVEGIIVNSLVAKTQFSNYQTRRKLIELVSKYVSAREPETARRNKFLVVADVTVGDNNYDFKRINTLVGAEAKRAEQAGSTNVLMYPLYYNFETNQTIEEYVPLILKSFGLPAIIASDTNLHHGKTRGRNITYLHLRDLAYDKHVCGLARRYKGRLGISNKDVRGQAKIFIIKPQG